MNLLTGASLLALAKSIYYICDIFTRSKYVQIHFLYSRKVQMPLSWKPMFCLYTSCSNIFSKSCLKVALALVNLLPSFCISDRVFSFLWPQVDFRVRKTFFLNEFLHFVAAILEIVVPPVALTGNRKLNRTKRVIKLSSILLRLLH